MAPTKSGTAKQIQNQRTTAATPVFGHDGTNIVINSPSSSSSNHSSFASLNIPVNNLPPGVTRRDAPIESPFTQFAPQQQSYNGMNMGLNPMSLHQQQFHGSDPLNASSSPNPSQTPGPNGFQSGYYGMALMRGMGSPSNASPNGFYPNNPGAHSQSGSLGPMFGNNVQPMQSPIQEPFSPSMQQQGQYGMPNVNFNIGYGYHGQQQPNNQQAFNMQSNNMYNMVPFNGSTNGDYSSYDQPSSSSADTPPDRDFGNGDAGMDVELDLESADLGQNGSYSSLLSPSTEMLTSPCSDNGIDTVVKGEDFGSNSNSLSLGEAKSVSGNLQSRTSGTSTPIAPSGKSSLPSSKEKEQNKQKLYRNRKSEFTNKMRDELLGMGMLPSTRVTHAPEIMSKTADTLRDYREFLELCQAKIEGMPSNIAAVPGALKKLLNENSNLFNNLRQPQPNQQNNNQQQQPQTQVSHTFKPDIKVPLGANMNTAPPARVTRSGAHHVF